MPDFSAIDDFSLIKGTLTKTQQFIDTVYINDTQTLTTKTFSLTSNTVTATSATTGDLVGWNGSKFDRFARGTSALQVLRVNAANNGIEWASLNAENTGIATATTNGSTTVFNIAHSIGTTPTVYMVSCLTHLNTYTYTADATNIVVTFSSAPTASPATIKISWRAVA